MKRSWLPLSLVVFAGALTFGGGVMTGVNAQTLCSCGHPCDLTLFQRIETVEVFEACNSITAASGAEVASPGSVTLRAGKAVVFDNASSVGAGGELHVIIDSTLSCDSSVDADADGFDACSDCDDSDFFVNPGASEICDGFDNNCNGSVDESCSFPAIFFSEYIEGSSSNRALEIYNSSPSAVDLAQCALNIYSNGSATATLSVALMASVASEDVAVVCHSSIDPLVFNGCDVTSDLSFNGNDTVELKCVDATLDVIGQIGVDQIWGDGTATSTQNATLRRKCSVTQGDANGSDPFDTSIEWDGFSLDDFSDLGSRLCP